MGEGASEIMADGHRVSGPVVSVLVTAFNREKYIAEAIESVLAQTFTDFELIVVDDCSKDHTVEIAQRYESDRRVRIRVNKENLGDYRNRNRAAELAQGQYLKYLDSDDVLYPHGLEVMVSTMLKYPTAALGLCRPSIKDQPYPLLLNPEQAYHEHFLAGGLLVEGPSAAIILASAFRSVGGFSGTRYIGDVELWLKLAAHYPVVKLMQGLVWWRQHDQQEQVAELSSHATDAVRYCTNQRALNGDHCPLGPGERTRAIEWLKHRHARSILRIALVEHKPRKALEIMRQSGFSGADLRHAFISARGLQDR